LADNQVNVDYTIGTGQAHKELEKIRDSLNKVTGDFLGNVGTIETAIKRMTEAMADSLANAAKRGQASLLQAQRRQDQVASSIYNRAGQGGTSDSASLNQANRAAGQAAINDIVNSAKAVQARITDAIVKATLQSLKTSEAAIEARVKQAHFAASQGIANSDNRLLSARSTLADQRRQDQIFAAENGRAALASRNRLEQINFNGGADLMGIQGRVMMNYAAVGTLFNTVKGAASEIIELDKELHQFQAISTATNREMVDFKQNLLAISATVPFSSLEMTKAATMLAQAGLSIQEVNQSLASVTKFATASGSDLGQSVDIVTSALTAFNLETSRTGDVANTFTAALNLSKLSVDKMVTAMNYIGPTASEVGLTLEETTSILGALSQSGIRASTMGTGFRSLLTDLQTPSKKLTETLKAAGLSVDDVNVKTKGFLPVIEALKSAGFGAAEAYQSLELRSAAAYVALSNNTEMAYDLQRSFILSAAATEANDIQMKSLANTAKNLGGVLTAAAYTGFEPVLNIVQRVLEGITPLLSGLNQVPGLLQTIGVGAAALGTIMAASLGMSLLKSLGLMIPVLGNIRAGIVLAATEAAAATGIFGSLTAALRVLSLVTPAGWIGLAATVAVTAAGAFMMWSDSSEDLAKALDDARARTSQLSGAADATEKKITSIDQAIQGVIDRKGELETNELMRGAKIDELRHQFAELGLSIKSDTASVTDLIRELHDLKQTSSNIRAAELASANSARADEIALLEKQQAALLKNPNRQLDRALTLEVYNRRQAVMDSGERSNLVDKAGSYFGPQIAQAIRFANGNVTGTDAIGAAGFDDLIDARIGDLRRGTSDTKDRDITFLTELKEVLKPLVANVTSLEVKRSEQNQGVKQQQSESARGSDAYKQLDTRYGTISREYNGKLSDLRKQGLTAEQELEALKALDGWLKQMTDDAIETFRRSFDRDSKVKGLNSEPIAREFRDKLDALGNSANGQADTATTRQRKLLEKSVRKDASQQNDELARLRRQISNATDQESLKVAKKAYDDFMKASTEGLKKTYEELIKVTTEPDALETRRDELADTVEKLAKDAKEVDQQAIEKEQELLKQSLQGQKEAIQDNIKSLRTQIDTAQAELKKLPPSEAFNKLAEKIRELTSALSGEVNKLANVDTRIESIDLSQPIGEAVAGSAQSAIKHFMERGLSKVGAAAVAGNLSVESGFNPTILGDNGSAIGAAQWRGSRRDELQATPNWNNLNTQYDFVLKELARDYPDLFSRLKAGDEDVSVLTKAFMDQYERPNSDPSVNHISKRLAHAQSFNTGANTAADADIQKTTEETDRIIQESEVKRVKSIQDATIKNLNSRLGTLKTQARINGDSGSIQEIQKQVQDAHAKIMDAELKKFDADYTPDQLALPDVQTKRQELQEKLRNNLNSDVLKVMEEYYKAADEELNRPVDAAKAKLDAARQPDMANKYTISDIQTMEQDVRDREREATANRILLIEKEIAEVRRYAAEAESAGRDDEANMWRLQENDLIAKNNELKAENNALDAAKAQQGPTTANAIQSATNAWAQQNGILGANNEMIPMAKQVENTWGQVLDGLSNGFSQFFMNISSGTMSAGEAFKQLGSTILQMFMQIIAKALANQIIMSLFGGSGGSSILGQLGEGLFGVVGGAATGKIVRAANGLIPRRAATGVAPFRDNVLVNVMPGEGILRKSAMDVIGEDGFNNLNNLGNRQVSEGALAGKAAGKKDQKKDNGQVNVWVVSPDQVPPPGPNDIIAAVADNISRRGTIKQLIQQVQMGAV
jgi:TP901 family phage tail tape measure protein